MIDTIIIACVRVMLERASDLLPLQRGRAIMRG
jgi:hypothetical protein